MISSPADVRSRNGKRQNGMTRAPSAGSSCRYGTVLHRGPSVSTRRKHERHRHATASGANGRSAPHSGHRLGVRTGGSPGGAARGAVASSPARGVPLDPARAAVHQHRQRLAVQLDLDDVPGPVDQRHHLGHERRVHRDRGDRQLGGTLREPSAPGGRSRRGRTAPGGPGSRPRAHPGAGAARAGTRACPSREAARRWRARNPRRSSRRTPCAWRRRRRARTRTGTGCRSGASTGRGSAARSAP